jgi:prefoldin subunit 5
MSNQDSEKANKEPPGFENHSPATEDSIGFEVYTAALAKLLTDEATDTPQTVSIEGAWGSGKSSFMAQLETRVSNCGATTVYFNPWRYDDRDDLWATFVTELQSKLHTKQTESIWDSAKLHFGLFLRRIRSAEFDALRFLLSAFVAILVVVLSIVFLISVVAPYLSAELEVDILSQSILIGGTSIVIIASALLTMAIQGKRAVFDPVRQSISGISPDYENRQSFLTEVDKDFDKLLDTYCSNERVFIFIDDLDRCEVPQTAEIVKYLNLIKEGRSNVIFVVGMDRNTVAAAVNVNHEAILPYLYQSAGDHPEEIDEGQEIDPQERENQTSYTSFGHQFLDKFITLPFHVPRPKPSEATELLSSPADPTDEHQETAIDSIDVDVLDDIFAPIDGMYQEIISSLDNNPRKIKKFRNLYKLQSVLANEREVLYEPEEDSEFGTDYVTPIQLAKYVALSIRWPLFASMFRGNPGIVEDIEQFETGRIEWESMSLEARYWYQTSDLVELLLYDVRKGDATKNSSLSATSIENLTRITPPTDASPQGSLDPSESSMRENREDTDIDPKDLSERLFGIDLTDQKIAAVVDALGHTDANFRSTEDILQATRLDESTVKETIEELSEHSFVITELEDSPADNQNVVMREGANSYALDRSNSAVNAVEEIADVRRSEVFSNRLVVLELFLTQPQQKLSAPRVESLTDLSQEQVAHELVYLRRQGLIICDDYSTSQLNYQLNSDHWVANWLLDSYRA